MAIEFDPNLTKEEKTPHMVTWWSTAHEKMIEASLTRAQVEAAVKSSEIILRENEAAFFDKLKNLPILLFSAGIADIVQAAMVYKANAGFTDNMKGKFSLRSLKNQREFLKTSISNLQQNDLQRLRYSDKIQRSYHSHLFKKFTFYW